MDRKQVAREIFEKTGLRVSESDPVMAMVAANENVLEQTMARFEKQMKEHVGNIVSASSKLPDNAEKAAVDLINRAGGWAEKKIVASAEAAAMRIGQVQIDAVEKAAIQLQNAAQKLDRTAKFFRNVGYVLGGLLLLPVAVWVGVKIGYMLPLPAKH